MIRAPRLLALVQALRRHRRPVTAQALAGELEVSIRTIYRDVAALVASGLPIRGEAGIGYALGEGYDLPPMMFTAEEIEAVALGLRWLSTNADASLVRAAQDAAAKIAAVLPKARRAEIFDTGLFAPRYDAKPEAPGIDEALVRRAIRDERKITLRYADARGQHSQRTLWPFGLAYFRDARVIMAWCELRQDFRHFRTDRIASLDVLAQRMPQRRADLLKRWQNEDMSHTRQITHMET